MPMHVHVVCVTLRGCLPLILERAEDCAHVSNSLSMGLMAGGTAGPGAADAWRVGELPRWSEVEGGHL